MKKLRVGFDLDDTLMAGPYGRLWLWPWVRSQEMAWQVEPGAWMARLRDAGTTRWRRGEWVRAYDWPDMVREHLGLQLPRPVVPDAAVVRPLVAPGAYRLLAWLWDRRAEVVLVTNGFGPLQEPYVEALGWRAVFNRFETPDRTGAAKPDPRMFQRIGPLSLFVGDRLWHDALGAQRVGAPAALVGPGPAHEDRWDPLGKPSAPAWHGPSLDHLVDDLDHDRVPLA